MRVSFNWLKDYVDICTGPEAVAEKLTMAGLEVTSLTRIDQDTIMEIEVTPNRADCLSIIGIAREVAAISGKGLKVPKISSFRGKSRLGLPIQIQAQKCCLRYLGRVIKNVKVGPSPAWLVHRLEVMGIRAVNNIADITNFCLLEFGQPLHAFDLDKLRGQRIIIRSARGGESIVTIDGVKRDLNQEMLVIADEVGPQAIAGIMGAKASEVNEATTNVLLESAYFNPLNIHDTSRRLSLATQSSYRFERGVDLGAVELASLRATGLIQKLAGAGPARGIKRIRTKASNGAGKRKPKAVAIGRLIDKGANRNKPNKVHLRFSKVKQGLGVELSPAQIKEFLKALQLIVVRKSKEGLTVKIPSFRQDISREVDLIEEIARLYGYDKIPLSLSSLTPNLFYTGRLQLASEETYNTVRQILSSLGLNEIMSYSLISRQALRKLELPFDNIMTVKNPLSYEQEILRPTLFAGMFNALLTNINRKNTNLKLFELSRIYLKGDVQAAEELTNLCVGIAGKRNANWLTKLSEYSFYDLKGVVEILLNKLGLENFRFAEGEYPCFIRGRCAEVFLGEEACGFLGEIKREILERLDISCPVYAAELKLHKLITHVHQEKKFIALARFPSIERDISLLAPQEVLSGRIVSLIKKIGRDLVEKVALFDQYLGEQIPQGFRGLSFSIEYRSRERTLTAQEVDKLHTQIRQALAEELKVQLR